LLEEEEGWGDGDVVVVEAAGAAASRDVDAKARTIEVRGGMIALRAMMLFEMTGTARARRTRDGPARAAATVRNGC